jgi:pimeloyl-ACP methyl ester carboxylesterase
MTTKVRVGETEIHVDQRGEGPDVLLIGGLSDPAESWEMQLEGLSDRYRLTAFDNRGAGRTPLPEGELTVELMAADAAAILDALEIESAHVAGFSGGSVNAQELALRYPQKVRSLVLMSTFAEFDPYLHAAANNWRWMIESAPSERAAYEAFFAWVYTPRAHADGTVAAIVEEALAYPYPQSPEAFNAQVDAWARHSTAGRLHEISAPTLVLAGGADIMARPPLGRAVADEIPGALFEIMPGEAHQPFQEVPDVWNARVDDFWRSVEAGERFPVFTGGATTVL